MTDFHRIINARVLLPSGRFEPRSVEFARQILNVPERSVGGTKGLSDVDGGGDLLTPGLIDLHIHAIGRFAFERSPQDLRDGLNLLPKYGVTSVLPTLYRVLTSNHFRLLEQLTDALDDAPGARVPGFHLEGPFLSVVGAGGLTLKPDLKFLDELLSACGNKVSAMSISPEVPGILPVIERLRELGIAVFITHTRASVEETEAAIQAGARHATHFYDVFPVPEEREAGVRPTGAVEAILADSRATVDFIPDGVHVHPVAIRAALAAKGAHGVIAITDANVGAGLPDGRYDTPMGFAVDIRQGDAARIADKSHFNYGKSAGSALTMDRAVANLKRWLPNENETPWLMASRNPAALLGLTDRGSIARGLHADLVLWDSDLRVRQTWIAGQRVYSRDHE